MDGRSEETRAGMWAAVLTRCGAPPEHRTHPRPRPPDGGVLVTVTAAPVTPLDLLCASGTSYFGEPALPYVPGVQAVGEVREGPGPLLGQRVWFATSAGMAPGDGGLAEEATARAEDVVPLPDGLDDTLAAALGTSALAAWEVLAGPGRLTAGERVLVLGASGVVGQVAVQAARLQGAGHVVAACRSVAGQELASALGADAVVPLGGADDRVGGATLSARLAEAAGGAVDVVVDPLCGVPATAALAVLAPGGRLVNLGGSAGPTMDVDSALLRGRSAQVLGYTNNSVSRERRAEVLGEVFAHAAAGRLTVDHDVVALADLPRAWADLAAGRRTTRVVARPVPAPTP